MNRTLEHILPRVQKPARYTGGEYNAVVKDRRAVDVRYALCFPDTYEIGMSNLGVRILYGLMNEMDGVWCERVFAPWGDMEEEMRREGIPLYGLESGDSIADFDLIGFSLGYEMAYTNVLNMLDLAGLPLRSGERTELSPIVVAGGTCAFNPEPLAPFVDLFVLGEGEDVSVEIIQLYRQAREEGWGKEEFLTAYTPYQAEMSQGILQSIFEYQTMICELTGMDVSNASVYDGAVAAAEAIFMCQERKRTSVVVSGAADPQTLAVIKTYCESRDVPVTILPVDGCATDPAALQAVLTGDTAAVYVQSPNYFGVLEDMDAIVSAAHGAGAKVIMGVNPISLGLLKTPGEYGVDIAVGEGQPLGMPLSFGGPYLGFMTCKKAMMRKLPGRIVGQTTDAQGNRCFVLTLQAREQHIRREKASSNICSNEALCAMTASVYLAAMGPRGLRQVAETCASHAHYLAGELAKLGFSLRSGEKPFFHEFCTDCPMDPALLCAKLEERGILGGLPVDGGILWCCTELNTKADMDQLIAVIGEVLGK